MHNILFSNKELIILGEIKLASPTEGKLGKPEDIEGRALAYEQAGVDIISVITEHTRFSGDTSFVPRIQKVTSMPILQKDFVMDVKQIYESKSLGVDALLLIASIVDTPTLKKFTALCKKLEIEPVVEVNDENDLKKALSTSTSCIAINARDLRTFKVDVDRACQIMEKIPDRYIKLGFSGIHTSVEVKKYRNAGAKGVLVGTALMKTENIDTFVQELRNP